MHSHTTSVSVSISISVSMIDDMDNGNVVDQVRERPDLVYRTNGKMNKSNKQSMKKK